MRDNRMPLDPSEIRLVGDAQCFCGYRWLLFSRWNGLYQSLMLGSGFLEGQPYAIFNCEHCGVDGYEVLQKRAKA